MKSAHHAFFREGLILLNKRIGYSVLFKSFFLVKLVKPSSIVCENIRINFYQAFKACSLNLHGSFVLFKRLALIQLKRQDTYLSQEIHHIQPPSSPARLYQTVLIGRLKEQPCYSFYLPNRRHL